jgi:hypothetical protein
MRQREADGLKGPAAPKREEGACRAEAQRAKAG